MSTPTPDEMTEFLTTSVQDGTSLENEYYRAGKKGIVELLKFHADLQEKIQLAEAGKLADEAQTMMYLRAKEKYANAPFTVSIEGTERKDFALMEGLRAIGVTPHYDQYNDMYLYTVPSNYWGAGAWKEENGMKMESPPLLTTIYDDVRAWLERTQDALGLEHKEQTKLSEAWFDKRIHKHAAANTRPSLEKILWSCEKRGTLEEEVANWLAAYGVDPAEAPRAVPFILGLYRRALTPGSPQAVTLCIQGEQGIGKSTGFQVTLPAPLRHLYSVWGLPQIGSDIAKNLAEAAIGPLMIEFAELAQLREGMAEVVKFLLGSSEIRARLPYAVRALTHKVTASFVCSVNQEAFLPWDASGYRRFAFFTSTLRRTEDHPLTEKMGLSPGTPPHEVTRAAVAEVAPYLARAAVERLAELRREQAEADTLHYLPYDNCANPTREQEIENERLARQFVYWGTDIQRVCQYLPHTPSWGYPKERVIANIQACAKGIGVTLSANYVDTYLRQALGWTTESRQVSRVDNGVKKTMYHSPEGYRPAAEVAKEEINFILEEKELAPLRDNDGMYDRDHDFKFEWSMYNGT